MTFPARGAASADFETAIRAEYPRLANVEFEVLRAIGPGSRRPLQRISRTSSIPAPAVIKDLRVTVAYVRPIENIVPVRNHNSASFKFKNLSFYKILTIKWLQAEIETSPEDISDNENIEEDQPSVSRTTTSHFQRVFGRPSSLSNSGQSSLAASNSSGNMESQSGGFNFVIDDENQGNF